MPLAEAQWGETVPDCLFPGGTRPRARDEDLTLPLVEGLTLLEAGSRLETPDRIRSFVLWFNAQRRPVTPAQVKEIIRQLTGSEEAIARW